MTEYLPPDSNPQARGSDLSKALSSWLDSYESCHHLAAEWNKGLRASQPAQTAEAPPAYGQVPPEFPATRHLYEAVLKGARSLNEIGALYVLGGGLAVNLHGHRRATRDVDFFILESHEKLQPIMAALAYRDLRQHLIEQPSFMPPDALFWWVPLQYGLPDSPPVDVDLLVANHEFMKFIHATGIEADVAGVRLRVLGTEALLVLKLQAFRDKDRWDLKEVLKAAPAFDRSVLQAWVAKFKLTERLEQMERELKAERGRRFG